MIKASDWIEEEDRKGKKERKKKGRKEERDEARAEETRRNKEGEESNKTSYIRII